VLFTLNKAAHRHKLTNDTLCRKQAWARPFFLHCFVLSAAEHLVAEMSASMSQVCQRRLTKVDVMQVSTVVTVVCTGLTWTKELWAAGDEWNGKVLEAVEFGVMMAVSGGGTLTSLSKLVMNSSNCSCPFGLGMASLGLLLWDLLDDTTTSPLTHVSESTAAPAVRDRRTVSTELLTTDWLARGKLATVTSGNISKLTAGDMFAACLLSFAADNRFNRSALLVGTVE
jgi:hypothetical protein